MRRVVWISMCTALTLGLCLPLSARKSDPARGLRPQNPVAAVKPDLPANGRIPPATAIYDTTVLGFWDFDSPPCDAQGWTSHDRTEQTGVYFHVDDFAGLGGGDFGRLLPLEGAQSLWCGARPDSGSSLFCRYVTLPGYSNNWNQIFNTTGCLDVDGDVVLDFLIAWDTEAGYDYLYIESGLCDDSYRFRLREYDGIGEELAHHVVPDSLHSGDVRFRIRFQSDGAWSDEDGLWDTDGAVIVDSLTVSDATGIVLATELFETESVGDTVTATGNWAAGPDWNYGDFSGLFPGTEVLQEDPCTSNLSCFWAFFEGSTATYGCGGWPDQAAVPYVRYSGWWDRKYIYNEIWSPALAWAGSGSELTLEFDVYRDLSLDGMVFYVWNVRSMVDGCWGVWKGTGYVYYGATKQWDRMRFSIGSYVEPNASLVQVSLGARDMCEYWYCWNEECHSHAPLFDDVSVYRVDKQGPQWSVRPIDLFQDTFATDGTRTGTARADIANDIKPNNSPDILPGDSVVVTVSDPEYGLSVDQLSGTGPAVYAYISVRPSGQPAKTGPALTDDPARWPVVSSFVKGISTWTQVRMDSVYDASGAVAPDRYCLDLHDDLFTPGDTVFFAFGAHSAAPSVHWTYWSEFTGPTFDRSQVLANPMEFTILPAAGVRPGGEILYVDGTDGRGGQALWDAAFEELGILDKVDRFDIRGPSSAVGNHPASRVADVGVQLVRSYRKILWDCGDLRSAFSDGSGTPDKSDDSGMLLEFLDRLETSGGVYLCGDDAADEWGDFWDSSGNALREAYMDFGVDDRSHDYYVGVSPLAVGEDPGVFAGASGPDTVLAYGGCPTINDFDVLLDQNQSAVAMSYHGSGDVRGAVLSQSTTNPNGIDVGFLLSGMSYQYIRGVSPGGDDAVAHLRRILTWLHNPKTTAVGAGRAPFRYSLSQNHPNPFNPTTTIDYSIARAGHVSLKVYNVAGQLVRTLVDEVQSPESVEPVIWDGRNNAGHAVSSGVYFYRLTTKGFTKTRKMVVLK
jgi:hypothetical protein